MTIEVVILGFTTVIETAMCGQVVSGPTASGRRLYMRLARKIRSIPMRISDAVRLRMVRSGSATSTLYYRMFGSEFSHEFKTLSAGLARYDSGLGTSRDVFHLRRNTHMLEKGLVMRPRRITFAEGYIEETVRLYAFIRDDGTFAADEAQWASHVLHEYFEATSDSESPVIARARSVFVRTESPIETRTHVPSQKSGTAPLPAIDALTALARARRSVRWFKSNEVPSDVIDRAITVAMEAPTACNRQPYRFLIVDDPALRVEVSRIPGGTAGFADQFPGLAVVIGDQSAYFSERDRHLIYIDSSLAAMGFVLALESQGVASCVINWTDIPEREARLRKALRMPRYEQAVMLIAFGYEDESALAPYSAKKSLEAVREYR